MSVRQLMSVQALKQTEEDKVTFIPHQPKVEVILAQSPLLHPEVTANKVKES